MTPAEMLKEEYCTLREEVAALMEELAHIERYCLYATGAVYVWLAAKGGNITIPLVWFIPTVLVTFAMARSWTIGKQLSWMSQYLASIEEHAYLKESGPQGWEHFLGEEVERNGVVNTRRGIRMKVTKAIWGVLLVLTLIFSTLGLSWPHK